jgi:predicted ArsR family transcriptional regulator
MAGHASLDGAAATATTAVLYHAADLRQAILVELRRSGPSTPDDLQRGLRAGRAAVLHQLQALAAAGLVVRESVRHGVGRPRHRYDLTSDAQGLLPTNYDALATGVIAAIEAVGGKELVTRVFEARRSDARDRVRMRLADRLPPGARLADRVHELAVIQDEQGYLCQATVEADGSICLTEFNCAIHHVAVGHPMACAAELELFRDVLAADVVRESHIVAGDRSCSYRVREIAQAE